MYDEYVLELVNAVDLSIDFTTEPSDTETVKPKKISILRTWLIYKGYTATLNERHETDS